jgi:peptide/nickel transport system permease protein
MTDLTMSPTTPGVAVPFDDIDEYEGTKKLGIGAWLSIAWLALLGFVMVFADFLPFKDPNPDIGTVPTLAPFQNSYVLGTDGTGRDMLSLLVYGGRVSLIISVCSVAVGFLVGGTLGLIAGYYRNNWLAKLLAGLFDILLAIPALVLALSLVAVLKGTTENPGRFTPVQILVFALGLVAIPLVARITRANALAWSQREFVLAARAQGASTRRILFREILPNVLPAMGYIAILSIGIAIVAEGGLAVLGASVEAPQTSWGRMIVDGKPYMSSAPFVMFEPIIALFFTVISLNFLGDVIRDRFDVRESAL